MIRLSGDLQVQAELRVLEARNGSVLLEFDGRAYRIDEGCTALVNVSGSVTPDQSSITDAVVVDAAPERLGAGRRLLARGRR